MAKTNPSSTSPKKTESAKRKSSTKTEAKSAAKTRQSTATDDQPKKSKTPASTDQEKSTSTENKLTQISFDKNTLLEAIELVKAGISNNPAYPILGMILIELLSEQQRLKLRSYNHEFGFTTQIEAQITGEGTIALPATLFYGILRKFPVGECLLTLPGNNEETEEIVAKLSPKNQPDNFFEIRGLPGHQYPEYPTLSPTTLMATFNGDFLISILQGSLFAASHEETKQVLTGSHFLISYNPDKRLTTLKTFTTDGHRMVFIEGMTKEESTVDEPVNLTIPVKALRELQKHLFPTEKIKFYFEENLCRFQWGLNELVSRTIDGAYPDCENIINETLNKSTHSLTCQRGQLQETLERFLILCTKSERIMKVKIDSQKAHLSISQKDVATGHESIDIENFTGKPFSLLYNVHYLLEIVKVIPHERIILHLGNSPAAATLITPSIDSSHSIAVHLKYLLAPLA